jgi:hypothetical protein
VKTPERVFAAEIDRGELPSLRAVKERMHVGTDRARVIRAELASTMQEATPWPPYSPEADSPVQERSRAGLPVLGGHGTDRGQWQKGTFPGRRAP